MNATDFDFDEDTYTITGGPLKPHEYVIIKTEMTAADKAKITNRSAKSAGSAKNPRVELTVGDVDLAMMHCMIVAWNRTKEDKKTGKQVPVPFTPENIDRMSDRLTSFIKRWIEHFNPDTDEVDKDFLPPVAASSETN